MGINPADNRSPTLVAKIAKKLRTEILGGAFMPGAALREIPLAEKYGTSRQTMREALRTLADHGLVELHSRRGAVLPKLTVARSREIYTLRSILEPFALRTGMVEGRIKEMERLTIFGAYEHMRKCAENGSIAELIEADMAFHWALCQPCGHQILLESLERLQAATQLSMLHMKVYGSDAEGEVESHAPILHAVNIRDAEGAAQAMHDHIIRNGERLLIKVANGHDE
ncbi:GntR family transcriptional regulator [Thalassospiraceae bacterium LMO-JJ14]|nr:GntR family transcriptional regulator [Thalassospiraceae bacterium LMO-JJ14]